MPIRFRGYMALGLSLSVIALIFHKMPVQWFFQLPAAVRMLALAIVY